MSLWLVLHVNDEAIGSFEACRSDREAIADVVSTYLIRVDGREVGPVRHRYGDGAWELLRKGLDLAVTAQRGTLTS